MTMTTENRKKHKGGRKPKKTRATTAMRSA